MIFYTSDLHLGHKNILNYEKRPFKTVEEMDNFLIGAWNCVVGRDDTVYVVGDFSLKGAKKVIDYIDNLNGNIFFINGNHDRFLGQEEFYRWLTTHPESERILGCAKMLEIKDEDREVVLCHYPLLYWDGQDDRGSYHIYGHMHSRVDKQHTHPDAFNVGVDVNNFRPVTLDQLLERRKCA